METKSRLRKLLCIMLYCISSLYFSPFSSAQRIIGYYPNYAYTAASANTIQYAKLTHLYYFTLNPAPTVAGQSNGTLWINDPFTWFNTTRFNDVKTKARAANPNIKLFIVTGGAPGSDWDLSQRLEYIGNNPAILNTFCDNIINFIVANDLDGWDLDWEFPETTSAKNAHQNMLAAMRTKINALKASQCRHYEITIAVGGGYTDLTSPRVCWGNSHTDFINTTTIGYLDFINIMAYDGPLGGAPCSFSSQQHYDLFVKSFNDWRTAHGIPASKINMGVGFYDNGHNAFNTIGNVNTRYNQTYWNGGSGCPNMQSKINFTRTQGAAGIFIWELIQDNLCAGTVPACYSLLDCIYQHTQSTWGAWTEPVDPCTLPVELILFEGKHQQTHNELRWTTASERNNQRFEIEKSTDGISFYRIGSVEGAENSITQTTYQYIDEDIRSPLVYYRLNQYDLNGTSTLSHIISISSSSEHMLTNYTVSPNPFENSFCIDLHNKESEEIQILIHDTLGNLLLNQTSTLEEGKINLGDKLPTGLFICTLIREKSRMSIRLVKGK